MDHHVYNHFTTKYHSSIAYLEKCVLPVDVATELAERWPVVLVLLLGDFYPLLQQHSAAHNQGYIPRMVRGMKLDHAGFT